MVETFLISSFIFFLLVCYDHLVSVGLEKQSLSIVLVAMQCLIWRPDESSLSGLTEELHVLG